MESDDIKRPNLTPIAKGRQTPSLGLEEVIRLLSRIRQGIGKNPASVDTVAAAIGHQSARGGAAATKIGALGHYGLLENVGTGSYKITELGERILLPRNDEEQKAAICEAVKKPALYTELFRDFAGQALPGMLPNILTRTYRVYEKKAEEAAGIFRESVLFAGLLRNGILYDTLDVPEQVVNQEVINGAPPANPLPPATADSKEVPQFEANARGGASDAGINIPILLPRKRRAILILPEDCDENDISHLKKWLDFHTEVILEK